MRFSYLAMVSLGLAGCAARPPAFRVIKPDAEFALVSPAAKKTSETVTFSRLMERQYNFTAGKGYIDLLPGMQVTAHRAYFSGTAIQLDGYLGTETGHWLIEPGGRFRFAGGSAEPGLRKPATEPPIEKLMDPVKRRLRVYRLFFQVRWFSGGRDDARGSVILGAPDSAALEAATTMLLSEKQPACGARLDCIPFPPATTVTAEVGVEVNGQQRWVPWGSVVNTLAPPAAASTLRVERRYGRAYVPVEFARDNQEAWRFPLLPGDRLTWAASTGSAAAERVLPSGTGAPIAFDTRGRGDVAIVFVHGWASDRTFWKEQADAFARDYRVVTLDLTGHGPFAAPRPPLFVLSLAADVEAVVRDLGLKRVVLVGHSMGGAVALGAAKRLTGIVRGVVLVTPEIRGDYDADFDSAAKAWLGNEPARDWVLERILKADRPTALNLLHDYRRIDFAKLRADAGVPVSEIAGEGAFPQLSRPAEFNDRLRALLRDPRY